VLGASTASFVALLFCMAVRIAVDGKRSHERRWGTTIIWSILFALLLCIIYSPWTQIMLGTASLSVADWLLVIGVARVYGLFVLLQRHARRHSRHSVLRLHQQTFGTSSKARV